MMDYLLGYSAHSLLVLCRVSGCLLIVPGFSSGRIPVRIRLYLAIALTGAIAPMVQTVEVDLQSGLQRLVQTVLVEIFIGALYGLAVRVFLAALEIIGEYVSASIGLTNSLYPSMESTELLPILSSFLSLVIVSMMFIMDVHHHIIGALAKSYDKLPIGRTFSVAGSFSDIMDFVAYSFMTALRIAGPFFIYSFGVNLVFGLASKLVPQFPGFFLSIPVLLIGGLYTIYLLLSDISQISIDGISWIISRL